MLLFFFKQKTAYEMRISDWSSDVCSSDLSVAIDCRWLQEIGVRPPHVSIIRVDGESMSPTLSHGDEIMVDHSDSVGRLRDGIYVLRLDDVLLVKRIAMRPRRGDRKSVV